MKKKVLLISLASTLAVGTCVAAVLFTRGQDVVELKGTEDLTLTINAGEITTSPTFTETSATFEHATDSTKSSETKNMVEFEYFAVSYGTQSETNYNYFQAGIGYIMNTKGHELKSLTSVTFQGYGSMQVHWGWLVDDAITYERYETVSAGEVFTFNDDNPNYIKMIAVSYGGNAAITQITFSYDMKCESSPYPRYTHTDGLEYYLHKEYAEVLGFSGSSVADLVIPDTIKGIPVTTIYEDAFRSDYTIETVTLGANVVELCDNVFYGSPYLTSITGIEQLERIGYDAFCGPDLSGTITFGPNLKSIGGSAFYGNNNLTDVVFDDACTASVNSGAFNHCQNIESCHIGSKMTSSVPEFYACYKFTSYTVGAGNSYYAAIDGNLYSFDGLNLQGKELPKGKTSYVAPNDSRVVRLNYEFARDSLLVTADLGDYITMLDGESFIGCDKLTTVTANALTHIGYQVFKDCTLLSSVTLPNTLTSMNSYVFKNCTSLTSITYKGTVAEWNAFAKDPNWNDGSSLTQIVCSDDTIIL